MKKCPSSIWCRDWNPQPSERESLPITTWPMLLPMLVVICDKNEGSGCGAVGRAVASNTRDLQFVSSHRKICFVSTVKKLCWNNKSKEKRGRELQFFQNWFSGSGGELIFKRSWVRSWFGIIDEYFFTVIYCKIVTFEKIQKHPLVKTQKIKF